MLNYDGHYRGTERREKLLKQSLNTDFSCSQNVSTFHFEMVLCSEVYLIFLRSKMNEWFFFCLTGHLKKPPVIFTILSEIMKYKCMLPYRGCVLRILPPFQKALRSAEKCLFRHRKTLLVVRITVKNAGEGLQKGHKGDQGTGKPAI